MTHARARSDVLTPPPSPTATRTVPPFSVAVQMPAAPAPGTCWLMSSPINLYALAYEAARMTVEANRQAWHRRHEASRN